MKRRLLSAFLAVMMVLTMAPVAFAVNEGDVAKIGDTGYATLAEAVNAAGNGSTITLLKDADTAVLKANVTYDLAGHVFTYTGGTFSYADKQTVSFVDSSVSGSERGGTLKLTGVRSITAAINPMTGAILNVNNLNVECTGSAFFPQGDATAVNITNCDVKSAVYCVGTNAGTTDNYNVVITLKDSTFTSTANDKDDCTVMINVAGDLNIENCVITGDRQGVMVRAGVARINNSEITTTGGYSNREQYYSGNWKSGNEVPAAALTVGNYSQNGASAYLAEANVCLDNTKLTGKNEFPALYVDGNMTYSGRVLIEGENTAVSGDVKIGQNAGCVDVNIYDGLFTMDVAKYCAYNRVVLPNNNSIFKYKVGAVPDETITDVKADASTGSATANTDKITDNTAKAAAEAAANSAVPTVSEKDAAAKELSKEEKGDALNALLSNSDSGIKLDADGKVVASDGSTTKVDVTVTKVIYLDIEVNAYDAANHTVVMDVTPKYNVVAKTSAMSDGATPIVVSTDNALTVTEPTTVTLKLDKSFFGDDVTNPVAYVRHTKDNKVYVYNTKITESTDTGKYQVEFVTPHGFSPMTITTEAPAAKIGDVGYTSLSDAVASAANGDTIKLLANCDDEITISKNVTIECGAFKADKVAAGSGYTKSVSGTTITIAKKSSGGSSSGSSSGKTTYKVTTSAVNNGGVNASPSSAEKGATITITLSPDKGYKLDKLTVTDGSGKTVSTVKKSDTVYTFTMPASAVNVGVSYVKATETPSETKFNDVSANDWFASAVDYVTGKGMMNGTADNTFSPKANTTRGMVVTVLYRLENQPSTSAASFTDVASGAYYANAVAWANANGIVSGYGSGKFGPNDKVTREQLAAILYRYAQYKKYDVSGANSLDGYADAQSVSSYAVPALQWANAAGVVTGKSGSKLDPKGNAARAEVAAMLMRFCENVK